jgi:hypothetical protein
MGGTATSHLSFVETGQSDSGLTHLYDVRSLRGATSLGQIRWYGPWRRYVFFPRADTLFDASCLTEIADFLHHLMEQRRESRREKET